MPREEDDEADVPVDEERTTAENLGRRVARVAAQLRGLSEEETGDAVAA